MRCNSESVRRVPYALLALVLLTIATGPGCTAWRGAALYHSGTSALDDGDVERALLDLGSAAELMPDASEVRNHLGLALLAAGREEDARRSFERAVALDCTNHAASDNLARTEVLLGREAALGAVSSGALFGPGGLGPGGLGPGGSAPAVLAPAVPAPGGRPRPKGVRDE